MSNNIAAPSKKLVKIAYGEVILINRGLKKV